jgi:hypothetical protein
MKFVFNYNQFLRYYQNLQSTLPPRNLTIFQKVYITKLGIVNYSWRTTTRLSNSVHPLLKHVLISFENQVYTYFNIPIEVNGILYGNHFSIGLKDRNVRTGRQLIDIHYTTQDPATQQSFKEETKCWIYDGKLINTDNLATEFCEVPRNKRFSNVYNNAFIDYIIVILATPFISNSTDREEIENIATRLNAIDSSTVNPPPSPVIGGKKHFTYKGKRYLVRIGKRGGKYILVNDTKVYIKH